MVHFSVGNSKMGEIHSVSLPAITSCKKGCACASKCYAARLEKFRKTMRESYADNLGQLKNDPDQYWDDINRHLKLVRFFRFHVSGDIIDHDYFCRMVQAAANNPHCEILCFTKQYEIVNTVMNELRSIPSNLHLVFSAWPGMSMDNPYKFPEAHVRFKDGSCTANDGAYECGGNCTECAATDTGCWTLHNGEQIVFNEH